jgi:hypothetical protein|tara:strand:+ start:1360 stop:1536 length:177 start_codon:yes stop_codon:yes gene_type:complete
MLNPDEIQLDTMNKMFEYEKQSREVDECNDVDQLKLMLKSALKLFLKQQETVSKLGLK